MVDYNVTSYKIQGDFSTVVDALTTQINAIDNAKVIHLKEIKTNGKLFFGCLIYDA